MWDCVPVPEQAPAAVGRVEVPGGFLGYWDTGGDGPAVVLLHAGTQSAEGWGYQQPEGAGVASEDLLCLVEQLGLSRVHLVAAAHGGFFALDFALSYPDRVATFSIVSSLLGIEDADFKAVQARLRPAVFGQLPHDMQELSPSYRAGNPEGLADWLGLVERATTGRRVTPGVRNRLDWAAVEGLRMPILLVTGDSDLYVPPSVLRMQASHMAGAEMHVIAEAGHSPYWEQPLAFNRVLLGFLGRH